ncbi:hypothetical protein HNR42_001855 [Deinobacterium chartae]|uniref:Membrane protein YczE n=1 Tax=Deinobacterium chartae TaxID=521158 RepID=A0A841HXZ8_9DEIO|nr:membrane protein [Deinobacterium chartae]MBB6098421.1 hypothetical protein [Deinobacterium chartae]
MPLSTDASRLSAPFGGISRLGFGPRFALLMLGLALFGLAINLMLAADLGLSPWDLLHQGIDRRAPLSFGQVSITVGLLVLLASRLLLGQRIGLGSFCNMLFIGVFIDLFAPLIPHPHGWLAWVQFVLGVVLVGLASGMYIGANFGAGPRDGLVLGLSGRFGWPAKYVRTGVELLVLAVGVLLGGTLGWGTLLFAIGVGPAMSFGLGLFGLRR